jgi:hypothetical protein
METAQNVEIPKIRNEWSKETFSKKVRAMEIGDFLELEKEYRVRQSSYINAKRSFKGATFSVQKQNDGTFRLIRIS